MLTGKSFYDREHTTPLYLENGKWQTQEMKLLSGFLLTAMILLVFKRNNWRENGHLVVSAYFCENIVTCQLFKAGKNLP